MYVVGAPSARKFFLSRVLGLLPVLAACLLLGACVSGPRPSGTRLAATPAAKPVVAEQDLLLKLLSAQFALQANDLAAAAQEFTAAAELGTDPLICEEATRLALATGDWPLAGRALARWQVLAPKDPGILQARAWLALGENRVEEAYADLNALAARGDDQAWRLIAQMLLGAADKGAATRLLERLATDQHLGATAANWIAVSQLAFKLGDTALAQRLANAAVSRFRGADAYVWSARLALDRSDNAVALQLYAEALKQQPDDLRLRSGYAALLASNGDNLAAAAALARGPQSDVTYGARAAYAARADDKAALNTLYSELLADKAPRSNARLYLMGQVAEMIGKGADALTWYGQVSDEDEHGFDARLREVVALDQLGRTADALVLLHRLEDEMVGDSDELGNVFLLEADLLARRGRGADARGRYDRGSGGAARRHAPDLRARVVHASTMSTAAGARPASRARAQARRCRRAERARLHAGRSHQRGRR